MKRRVILLGAPGAGKGTQAKMLASAMHVPHISTGDMLRDAVSRGTDLGKQAETYMQTGALVPDALVNGIVAERLASELGGYLLDGYPRTVGQADALKEAGEQIEAAVLIDVSDDLLVERITGRLSCPSCGAVYHRVNRPPRESGKCDICSSALTQRPDDTESVVRSRLDAYHKQTQPLVDYYEKLGVLYRVDGTTSVDAAYEEIRRVLEF
ncbi:MAG: adenylate kinase [Proteobacteria bacterium]|nr:adenylate kinase [Pseudomonadota bacterium]